MCILKQILISRSRIQLSVHVSLGMVLAQVCPGRCHCGCGVCPGGVLVPQVCPGVSWGCPVLGCVLGVCHGLVGCHCVLVPQVCPGRCPDVGCVLGGVTWSCWVCPGVSCVMSWDVTGPGGCPGFPQVCPGG